MFIWVVVTLFGNPNKVTAIAITIAIYGFGNLGSWEFGILGIWDLGILEIWEFVNWRYWEFEIF